MLEVLVKVFSNDRLGFKLFFNYDYSYKKNRVVGKHIFAFPATRFEDIPIIS